MDMFPAFIHNADTYTGDFASFRSVFLQRTQGDTICVIHTFTLETTYFDFLAEVAATGRKVAKGGRVIGIDSNNYIMWLGAGPDLLLMVSRGSEKPADTVERAYYSVHLAGPRDLVIPTSKSLKEQFGGKRLAEVTWWYGENEHPRQANIILDPPDPLYDEFYPWIDGGVEAYFQRYMDSASSLLFLSGDPGTGKTSLIRHFLYGRGLSATLTYQEEFLSKDGMFVEFMTAPDAGVLIIEDADTMLSARAHDGNKLISRFLNVSDGLVKFRHKKIIFTTNLTDFRNTDEALTRPGRCFDTLRFRALSFEEAQAAAKVAGLEPPEGPCTIGELFNRGAKKIERSMGFATVATRQAKDEQPVPPYGRPTNVRAR